MRFFFSSLVADSFQPQRHEDAEKTSPEVRVFCAALVRQASESTFWFLRAFAVNTAFNAIGPVVGITRSRGSSPRLSLPAPPAQ